MFMERIQGELKQLLIPKDRFTPFPRIEDRKWWEAVDPSQSRPILEAAEAAREEPYPQLTATRYMDFQRDGNRSRYEASNFARRRMLNQRVLAECFENQGRYIDSIIDGIWLICEESSWCLPAHNELSCWPKSPLPNIEEPFVDLFAAETAGDLAYIYYLMGDRLAEVSPLVPRRIVLEIQKRIIAPFMMRDDYRWMGIIEGGFTINWNPWITSNVMTCLSFVETDPYVRAHGIWKCIKLMDRFAATYHSDGGCDEGPSYWGKAGGALFDCLDLLAMVSDGRLDFFDEPLVRAMGQYIYKMHIADEWFVNFADCSARLAIGSDMVMRFGARIHDPKMVALGEAAFRRDKVDYRKGQPIVRPMRHMLPLLAMHLDAEKLTGEPPMPAYSWMDGIQVMTAREKEGSADGFFVAAKGGHNDEAHNHNDVGNFIVYRDGQPVICDAGVERYSAKTFNPATRYTLWTMQSGWHNLPKVRGVEQKEGAQYRAGSADSQDDGITSSISVDIAPAYPEEAGIRRWLRTVSLDRSAHKVTITEDIDLGEATQDVELHILTWGEPTIVGNTASLRGTKITWPEALLDAAMDGQDTTQDPSMQGSWGDRGLYRIVLKAKVPMDRQIISYEITEQ